MLKKYYFAIGLILISISLKAQIDPSIFKMEPLDLGESKNVNVTVGTKKERSILETLQLKIQDIIYREMQKYSEFYLGDASPNMGIPVIHDAQLDETGNQILIGEYTYDNDYENRSYQKIQTKDRTLKFMAYTKKIIDEYTISKIVYKRDDEWYILFPSK